MNKFNNNNSPNPGKSELIVLLVIFGLIFLFFKCTCSKSDEEKVIQNAQDLRATAYFNSQECVKDLLKSPSTAEFPYGSEQFVTQIDEDTFIINSYVDSQNSFGAMLRTQYVCQVTLIDNENYTCDSVKLLEQ